MRMLPLLVGLAMAGLANAQAPVPPAARAATRVQSSGEAFAQDAVLYARQYGLRPEEALQRLRALQESAPFTDGLRASFKDRLAGIAIDHAPTFRIRVLLTGTAPVADTIVRAGGLDVSVQFATGAKATADDVTRAMLQRAPKLQELLPNARGMGLDARTGELVILIGAVDAARADLEEARGAAEAATGVPVRLDRADRPTENLALAGGARVEGSIPGDPRRFVCTTGFAVTDGIRAGMATAAHCPDDLQYQDPEGGSVSLAFVGQWGARTQDVQVNLGPTPTGPLFYSDRRGGSLRSLAGSRSRLSTRAGEWLCHYGESSGYSCSEVELTNFAPPGQLCAGPCAPTWVSVRTRDCKRGDSGGPVFVGDIAFGIAKGGSGARSASCNFYFYMSTDFLPVGWRLLH